MPSNIAIIFGAGARVGSSVAKQFLANNYKVVTVSRNDLKFDEHSENHLHVKRDLSDVKVVPSVFTKTRDVFGEPRVIIYNVCAASVFTRTSEDFLSVTSEVLNSDQNVNVTSAFLAIQESVKSFQKISDSVKPKAFIYTGNIQNVKPLSFITTAGIGKSGAYSAVGAADQMFGSKGYRFYYADERRANGDAVYNDLSAEGAAEFYFDLAENENKHIPVEATFISGKGYAKF